MGAPESHVVRGMWLERAIDIEQRVNRVLQGFFNVPGRFWVEFDWWILNEMPWNSKVKAIRSIIAELTTLGYDTDPYDGLVPRLEALGVRRNTLAHRPITHVHEVREENGKVAPDGTVELVSTDLGPHLVERRPKSRADSHTAVDLEGLLADAATLDELISPIVTLEDEVRRMWPYSAHTADGVRTEYPGTLTEHGG